MCLKTVANELPAVLSDAWRTGTGNAERELKKKIAGPS